MVAATSIGWLRLRSSHRVARSASRRASSRRPIWVAVPTTSSSSVIWAHSAGSPKISRAAICARATSGAPIPVSSVSRKMKVVPARSTMRFVTRVAMISRRSGCSRIWSA